MILRPELEDYKIVGYYLGKVTIGIGLCMLIPLAIARFYAESQPMIYFLLGISLTLLIGFSLAVVCHTKSDLETRHAMAVSALSWLMAMFVSAVPLYLSGHFGSYLDACFEAMSGYATTGLSLAQDLDHMAKSINFWRHLMMFLGGQGIVVIALTFLFRGTAGAFRMYAGEARDEKILPNVVQTSRFIWMVSIIYLVIGSTALFASAMVGGLKPINAIFDSVCIFIAAFDTGGFTPHSQNILFYHNFSFEMITIVLMVLGAMNFALHYALWSGNRKELLKNIEIVTLSITVTATLSIAAWGLVENGVYAGLFPFFSKTFYQLISAHTGTGYSTIYPRQFTNEWGPLSMLGIMIAMAIGGSVCSTTGGIKLLRVGVIYKALRQDIKRMLLPETAVLMQKVHHIKNIILNDRHVRSAALILLSYSVLYLIGTIVGMLHGFSLSEASFESISASANVGLSCGITSPFMPTVMKFVYIFQMWAGRLEFMAIFVLAGMILSTIKGRR